MPRLLTAFLLLTMTLAAQPAQRPEVLMEADRAFERDTLARGLDGWMSWFADDARIETTKEIVVGRAALRDFYTGMFAQREFSIRWKPEHAELSSDGTLGYTFGRSEIKWRDDKGELQVKHGRYTTVWRRQKDGSYKVVFDIGA